jgi:8-oxo-dGTP pyrophosphatase MutT (NUDIX family)
MSADELAGIERRLVEAEEILSGNLAASSSAVEHDPFMWAYEIVQGTVDRGDEAAVRLLLEELAITASDERRVGLLGAGPLDDLVHERMPETLDLLKELAASNATIRVALAEIWIDDDIDGSVASWLLELRSPEK